MSRRDQIHMTDDEMVAYLAEQKTITLVSNGVEGFPHPMPMWFGVEDDGAIVMSTFTKSQKIKNLARDPRVSLLVEDGTEYNQLRGAVLYGKAELISDTAEVIAILVLINASGPDVDADVVRNAVRATAPKRTGIRIRPDRIVSWDHGKLGGVY